MTRSSRLVSAALLGCLGCMGSIGSEGPSTGGETPPGAAPVGPGRGGSGAGGAAATPPPGGTNNPPPVTATDGTTGPRAVRRLTRLELTNTFRDLVGEEVNPALLPEDASGEAGFATGGVVSTSDARRLLEVAEGLGAKLEAKLATLVACDVAAKSEEGCARAFVGGFGRRAFRRPVTAGELDAHVAYYQKARSELKLPHAGALRLVLQVMLQSSSFLYHWELGPTAPLKQGTVIRLNAHEVASRLSYFLWSTMPDAALFAAADGGALASAADVEKQARRMLADPRARQSVAAFHRAWLHLGEVAELQKTAKEFDATVAKAMDEEVAAFTTHVMLGEGGGKLDTLLTAPFTVAAAPLAKIYGVTAPSGTGAAKMALEPTQRAGILTQAGFLAANATAGESHPVRRGVLILERLFCSPPPPIPDNVPDPKPPAPTLTTRERFAEHSKNECASACHALIDPLGFAFENYDAIGRFRTTENGKPVDASGSYTTPAGKMLSFTNGVNLVKQLAASEEVRDCVARQWLRYALGRADGAGDATARDEAKRVFASSGHDLRELLVAVATSRSFLTRTVSTGEVLP